MFRKLVSVAILGVVCTAMSYADDKKKTGNAPGGGKVDRSMVFAKIDTNGDGKVTKGEYTTFMAMHADRIPGGKGGNVAEIAAKRFAEMDTNKDSVVTMQEFAKAGTGQGGNPAGQVGARGGQGKNKSGGSGQMSGGQGKRGGSSQSSSVQGKGMSGRRQRDLRGQRQRVRLGP